MPAPKHAPLPHPSSPPASRPAVARSGTYAVTRSSPRPSDPPLSRPGRAVVLVVVPDDGTREDILVALAPRYRAYGARDAEEASEILAWIEPRAVLCDATSPSRLDGFALVRRLRADQPGRCAFVMLTRARCGSDMIHALQAGARCCVEVPVDLAAMGSALCRILS